MKWASPHSYNMYHVCDRCPWFVTATTLRIVYLYNTIYTTRLPSRLKHIQYLYIHSSIVHCRCMIQQRSMCVTTLPRFYIECDLQYTFTFTLLRRPPSHRIPTALRDSNGGGALRGRGPQSVVMEFQNSGNNQSQTCYNTS